MEPNDLPIMVLPLELCDDCAAILIDFLHELTDSLERHYAGQLLRRHYSPPAAPATSSVDDTPSDPDPPF